MKARLFLCFFLLVLLSPITAVSQQVRVMRIKVIPSEEKRVLNYRSVYLMTKDTILQKVPLFNNEATFYFKNDVDENKTYVVLRQNKECIFRIKLKDLIQDGRCFQLLETEVSLVEDNTISEEDSTVFLRNKTKPYYEYERKLWPDFSPEGQMRLYDTVRWFFPTETMLNVDVQKERIHNSYYLQNYHDEFGRYPSEQELDTLAKNMSVGTAEELIGWYTWNLLRLKEDELCNGSLKDIYRFTMVSNTYFYTYEPYSMRIEPNVDGTAIMFCSYERYDECERKTLYCDIVPLGAEDYSRIQNIVKQMRFWEAKPTENPYDLYKTAKTNILEANIDGKYHVIFRGEGEDEGMEELREFLWGLTGLGENKIVHKRQRIE